MHLRYFVAALLLASVALWPGQPVGGEAPTTPPAPAPAPAAESAAAPAPAAPTPVAPAPIAPAAPAATSAAAPKGPPVIMVALPPMSGVFGGKVEFAEKAFPIVVESTAVAVQTAIRNAKPLPCPACRGTGKVAKRETFRPPTGCSGKPITQTWEEDCPACFGCKDVFDPRFGQRLVEMVDRLAHMPRDDKFDDAARSAGASLCLATEVRSREMEVCRYEREFDSKYSARTGTESLTFTGVKMIPEKGKSCHVEVAPIVEPLWTRVGSQPPTGQAVIIIGRTSDKTEAGGWVWMRMQPAKGTAAIILCGTPQKNVVPEGRIVLGGLMVGRWSPEGGTAPASPASAAPAASLPVILVVASTDGANQTPLFKE
ncbi:MAG: hypothetical protein NT049_02920 [Planctomycetota bacterium]|nr:hypothetical protein [Planctomycetota bacterium]